MTITSAPKEDLKNEKNIYNKTVITLEQAREALGKTGQSISDENIQKLMTIADYLTDNWLEEYEKTIFDGKTLEELLQNG